MVSYTITYVDETNERQTLTLSDKVFFEIPYDVDTLTKKFIFSEYIDDATEDTELDQLLQIGSWHHITITLNSDNITIPLLAQESVSLARFDITSNRDRNGNDDQHDTDLIKTLEIR